MAEIEEHALLIWQKYSNMLVCYSNMAEKE